MHMIPIGLLLLFAAFLCLVFLWNEQKEVLFLLCLTLVLMLLIGPTHAQGFGQWTPSLHADPCPVDIVWEPSPYPWAPYPSGNYMKISLGPGEGFINHYNFEVRAQSFSYSGPSHCVVQVGGLPLRPYIGQGFYGSAYFQGVRTHGITQIVPRTMPGAITFMASGVNRPAANLRLSDLCSGCAVIFQGTVTFHSEE